VLADLVPLCTDEVRRRYTHPHKLVQRPAP